MAIAIAVTAEPATEAAQQEDDQDDDEYHAKRHGVLPRGRAANENPPPRQLEQSISRLLVPAKEPEGLFRLQFQRRRIDAVTQSGRAGAILEHVTEMAAALRAQPLGPDHAVADVALLVDMARRRGRGKTRPAAAGIEFGVGFEQRLAAASAGVGARRLLMLVRAGERPFGGLLAQYRVL